MFTMLCALRAYGIKLRFNILYLTKLNKIPVLVNIYVYIFKCILYLKYQNHIRIFYLQALLSSVRSAGGPVEAWTCHTIL